jgi:hypothetical protein
MGYNIAGSYVNCWSCGRHKLAETVAELTGLGIHVVYRLLRGIEKQRLRHQDKPRGKLVLPKNLQPILATEKVGGSYEHQLYLKKRFEDVRNVIKLYELKAIGFSSNLKWRIFIPIIHNGVMVSWTTRSIIKDTQQRYISAAADQESFPHKELLFAEDYVRNTIIVTEGPFDAMRIGPGAVATMGTGFNLAQLNRIKAYPRRVVCFDSVGDAQDRAKELCEALEVFPGETYNVTLSAKDPSSASLEEIQQLRDTFLSDQTAYV